MSETALKNGEADCARHGPTWVTRFAELGDAPAIIAGTRAMALETEGKILPDAVDAWLRRVLDAPPAGDACYLVAEDEVGEFTGFLLLGRQVSDFTGGWYLTGETGYTQPEHRGSGVSSALMHHAEQLARACGAAEVRCNVLLTNPALRHWLNLGYEPTGYIVLRKVINAGPATGTVGWRERRVSTTTSSS